MNVFRLAPLVCRSRLFRHQVCNLYCSVPSTTNPKLDFRAIEAKWRTRWKDREGGKVNHETEEMHEQPSLAPLYSNHLRPMSILDTLRLWNSGEGDDLMPAKDTPGVYGTVLDLANSGSIPETGSKVENGLDLETCTGKYGADITRAYVIFRGEMPIDSLCNETRVRDIQRSFKLIWKATLLAHKSYIATQPTKLPYPDVPDTLYEPSLETWLTYQDLEPKSWVYIPPEQPDVFRESMKEEDCTVWLAAQRAINSVMGPVTDRDHHKTVRSCLATLAKAIIKHDASAYVLCNVPYHSARVLLCLIAPLVPALAEECWVVLHYGIEPQGKDEDDEDEFPTLEEIHEYLAEDELLEDLGHLPRQRYPETLGSILDEPFPVPEDGMVMKLLEDPLLRQDAIAKRSAEREVKCRKIAEGCVLGKNGEQ